MADVDFNENLLSEKLSKLNSSQQSIESLSRWCVSHRKKAKQVVEKWETLFKSAPRQQRVSFLYLANDILQNSRRKGSEFVNEFWKVLPASVKDVYDSGEENCRKVATRLVNIWEERKVFGSRGQNLKTEVLGKDPPPATNPSPVNSRKNSNPIKALKRDANSLRIKLAVGGLPEKILTAFQLVHDEIVNEEVALNNCRNAASSVREIEENVSNLSPQGNMLGSDVVDNIQKQEDVLLQCISQLEEIEAIRVGLVSQLTEALQDQESKLELIRSELHVARSQIGQAASTRLHLTSTSSTPPHTNQVQVEPTFPPIPPTNNPVATPAPHPFAPSVNPTISEEESKRATAAAVAAKLTASSSSAEMLASVLSSLVAEETASMSSGLKRPRSEKPMLFSDANNSEGASTAYIPGVTNVLPVESSSTQSVSQLNQLQAPFVPPLPPFAPPANSPANPLVQMGLPYGYGASNVPHPPLSSNGAMGFSMPGPPPQRVHPQQLPNQQPQQQLLENGGYYRPVGIGFYGQSHQPPATPINRQ
ncbi:Regulator of nuclear mRNA [Handroanthus impetiginosus]|uniref:Regulator of nuclear mRNA n=1 Tax=Handroanthus impetiginosus TaxID=429701 RepID=A0A2G9HTR4_9LAMI|nr:Regulator of nuclear mRNA [Handroanthus impetiginosus]